MGEDVPVPFDFDPHGFAPGYDVEAEPEFPADGVWTEPLYCYDHDGQVVPQPATRWGAPFVIRVAPERGDAWVGMFAAGDLGGEAGAHACPRRDQLCIVVNGRAYLVGVDAPANGATPLELSVTQIVANAEPHLLLFVNFSSITALGPTGIAWQTGRIALDGLRVDRIADGHVCLRADNLEGGIDHIILDVATGEQVEGRRFQDSWPPDALA